MRCEGPLTEQERSYREYSWKAASTRTADIGHLGTTRIIFSASADHCSHATGMAKIWMAH